MILTLVLTWGMAAATPHPLTRAVTLNDSSWSAGDRRRLSLITRRVKGRDVNVLMVEGPGRASRVIPRSLARQIDAEMRVWRGRLARAPRGLQSVNCAQPVTIDQGPRRGPLCLDRAPAALRRDFLAWYRQTTEWLQ